MQIAQNDNTNYISAFDLDIFNEIEHNPEKKDINQLESNNNNNETEDFNNKTNNENIYTNFCSKCNKYSIQKWIKNTYGKNFCNKCFILSPKQLKEICYYNSSQKRKLIYRIPREFLKDEVFKLSSMSSDEQYDYYNNIMKHVIQKPILQHSTIKSRIIKEISSINYDQENIKINIEIQPIDDYKKLKFLIYSIFKIYKDIPKCFYRLLKHYFGKNPYFQLCRLLDLKYKIRTNWLTDKDYVMTHKMKQYLKSRKFLNSDAFYSLEINQNIYSFSDIINLIETEYVENTDGFDEYEICNNMHHHAIILNSKARNMINLIVFLEQADINYIIENIQCDSMV
jgi:hypothetical protein